LGIELNQVNFDASLTQLDGGAHATDASPNNEHFLEQTHLNPLTGAARIRRLIMGPVGAETRIVSTDAAHRWRRCLGS
jgi:hypothetical protein